jgi:hypothetical protein
MRKKTAEFILTLTSVFASSYVLNYVWESFHAVFLYKDHDFNAKKYVLMLNYASAVDGILILGIYLFVAVLWRDVFWLKTINRKQICVAFAAGVVSATFIEYVKVFVIKAWSYAGLMPTLFGIGVSPLFQLSTTGLIAFWLARRLVYQNRNRV